MLDLEPDAPGALAALGQALLHAGRIKESIGVLERALDTPGEEPGAILAGLASAHAREGAMDTAHALVSRAKVHLNACVHVGLAYAAMGEPDSAFAWLARFDWTPIAGPIDAVRYDPRLDAYRGTPRYRDLLAHVLATWNVSGVSGDT